MEKHYFVVTISCRLSQLREFSLCHWKKHVDYVIQVIIHLLWNFVSGI